MLISLMGMTNYDQTIKDAFTVPSGIDRDIAWDYLLTQTAELSIFIPSFDYLKQSMRVWCAVRARSWEKQLATVTAEYNPIHNYDRMEEWNDTRTDNLKEETTVANDGKDKMLAGQTHTTTQSPGQVDTLSRTAFNTTTMAPAESRTVSGTNTQAVVGSGNDTVEYGKIVDAEKNNTGTQKNVRTGRAYGNIGVTTTQQMLEAERDIAKYTIYNQIVEDFKAEFCILVY